MNPEDIREDLKQEVFLVLCEMEEERLLQMYNDGYLKFFIVRTILNMVKSDRSNFARTFRQTYEELTDLGISEVYDLSLIHI